jgi:hypothetical protein
MKFNWIECRKVDLNKFPLIVVFKDAYDDEVFTSMPKFVGAINRENTCLLFIRFSEGRFIWQMFEIRIQRNTGGMIL